MLGERTRELGVSLLEVLVVVAIVASLVALAAPSFADTINRQRGRGAVEGVRSVLQLGRSEALKQNANMFVSVVPGQSWCIALSRNQACGCTDSCADGADLLQRIQGRDFPGVSILSASFAGTLCGSTECVRFEPRQGTAQGSNGTVVLASNAGAQYRILVATMGRVRVCVSTGDSGAPWPRC